MYIRGADSLQPIKTRIHLNNPVHSSELIFTFGNRQLRRRTFDGSFHVYTKKNSAGDNHDGARVRHVFVDKIACSKLGIFVT